MPLCWWFDKKRKRNLEFYIFMFTSFICMFISFPCFIQKGEEAFWEFIYACLFFNWYQSIYVLFIVLFMQKGEKYSSFMHICVIWFIHSLNIFIVYCYAWVKRELLRSLTLIHTYITPWVLSSSKRGRLLDQRPSTLVLMMINSCSYSLLIILWYLVSDIWSRY